MSDLASLEVFPCGTKVMMNNLEVPGVITGICIRGNLVATYEISHVSGDAIQNAWFSTFDFRVNGDSVSKAALGFTRAANP
jgi:hypothetical protein